MDLGALINVLIALIGFVGGIAVAIINQRHANTRQQREIDQANNRMITELKEATRKDLESFREVTRKDFLETRDSIAALGATYQTAIAVLEVKIADLSEETKKHNNFGVRIPLLEEQIKVANHRIEDLEKLVEEVRKK